MAWFWQRNWQKYLINEPQAKEAVWLLQHSKCYTLGRGSSESNLYFDLSNPPAELHRIDRGGEVTYHLQGQLVVYPVLDLRRRKTDLHWYLRKLEQVFLDTLQNLGLKGQRIKGLTGVWIDGMKVAAIGVGCRRWVTQHGMAINVDCELDGFFAVSPCGLEANSIGKLDSWIPGIKVEDLRPLIQKSLGNHFDLTWEPADISTFEQHCKVALDKKKW